MLSKGMAMSDETKVAALAAVREIRELLQRAHFAARRLEEHMPSDKGDRLVDHIHGLRTLAEHFVTQAELSLR